MAWRSFKRGKTRKKDVLEFELNLENNILKLHEELMTQKYKHENYTAFVVCDPKRREIHKASVRDRVLQQALYQALNEVFDKYFISDSFSSRVGKGTHCGVDRLERRIRKESSNWKKPVFALKCDVRKFFGSIDHIILQRLIFQKVSDEKLQWLIGEVIGSFGKEKAKGLPLGNVTSQLFGNIYMNEFDQFAKHTLKAKHYFRYCDDFVILSKNKEYLETLVRYIEQILLDTLKLTLHPDKVEIRKVSQGVDFLGYVVLPFVRILRTNTKSRILRRVSEKNKISYLGVLSHCRGRALRDFVSRIPKT